MIKQQYYNVKDVETICQVSHTKAYEMMRAAGITNMNGAIRVERNRFQDYLEQNTAPPYKTERERRQERLRKVR